jgi:hypothetical protein
MGTATAVQIGTCRVLDEDPDLASRLSDADAARARTNALAACTRLERGIWDPPAQDRCALGFLVLDGAIARYAAIDGCRGVELIGHGDLIRPWDTDEGCTIPFVETWEIVVPTRIALFDAEFSLTVAEWPGIMAELLARTVSRNRALVRHRALSHLPHLETRILLVLWEIADRWGRAEPDGVSLSLPITQRLLADLVSASRQRVNRALADLARSGAVERRRDRLLLRHGSSHTAARAVLAPS